MWYAKYKAGEITHAKFLEYMREGVKEKSATGPCVCTLDDIMKGLDASGHEHSPDGHFPTDTREYNTHPIFADGPELAHKKFSGVFDTESGAQIGHVEHQHRAADENAVPVTRHTFYVHLRDPKLPDMAVHPVAVVENPHSSDASPSDPERNISFKTMMQGAKRIADHHEKLNMPATTASVSPGGDQIAKN
jgi:hypothetical protein